MAESEREELSHYVRRIMRERNLTLRDVELMSGGGITDGYVGGIISGRAKNLTVGKLKALALGLGVAEDEVFCVARGLNAEQGPRPPSHDAVHAILSLMCAAERNPLLIEILYEVARLSPGAQAEGLHMLRMLNGNEPVRGED